MKTPPGQMLYIYSANFTAHQYEPIFYLQSKEVNAKLQTLIKTGISEAEETIFYVDQKSNEQWILIRYDSEYVGGEISVLKKLPELKTGELINIAITSLHKNDIIAASIELLEREKYNGEDFRENLLGRLLNVNTFTLSDFEKERLNIIIYESTLYDSTNRREIVGKHFTEIQNDADYYQKIAKKAKGLLAKIEK